MCSTKLFIIFLCLQFYIQKIFYIQIILYDFLFLKVKGKNLIKVDHEKIFWNNVSFQNDVLWFSYTQKQWSTWNKIFQSKIFIKTKLLWIIGVATISSKFSSLKFFASIPTSIINCIDFAFSSTIEVVNWVVPLVMRLLSKTTLMGKLGECRTCRFFYFF